MGYVFGDERHKLVKGHYGAADNEIEFLTAFADIAMLYADIRQTDNIGHRLRHTQLLPDAVNKVEMTVGAT